MQPRGLLAAYIPITLLTLLIPALHLYQHLHSTRTRSQRVSTALYTVGVLCVFAQNLTDIATLHDEIRIRAALPSLFADLAMLAPKYLQRLIATGLVYYTALWCFKGAFLSFFWYLFVTRRPDTKAWSGTRVAVTAAAAYTGASYVTVVFAYTLGCRPFAANWSADLSVLVACSVMFSVPYNTAGFALDVSTDIFIVMIPLVLISRLQLRTRAEWVALLFVFTIGIVSPVAATVRYVSIRRIIQEPQVDFQVLRVLNLFSSVEYWTALVAFALPSFRAVLGRVWRRRRKGRKRSADESETMGGGEGGSGRGRGRAVRLSYISMPDEEAVTVPLPTA
ncbi:hypothetical protein EDC01DRAFT_630506 [Geopyxis carbonaria]|nr:hypothetical protein EDC01DRAFT_630506 [Geopyxis carbonaria]